MSQNNENKCGRCCKDYAQSLYATSEDLKRWVNEGRYDILEKFEVILADGEWNNGNEVESEDQITLGSYMINPRTGESYVAKCPFLKKDQKKIYYCSINSTKPDVCSHYTPWEWENIKNRGCPVALRLVKPHE